MSSIVRFLFALGCLFTISNIGYGQVSLVRCVDRVKAVVETMESVHKAQVLYVEIDNIEKFGSNSTYYDLFEGRRYMIYAVGDGSRITDIDLFLYNSADELLDKDSDDKNVALTRITPSNSGRVYIKVSAYAGKESITRGFYGIVIGVVD